MSKPKPSYTDMKAELDDLILSLQRDDIGIDEALESYERGLKLLKDIESYIAQASNKIKEIKSKFESAK
jgi:exodeoxyribonuclease VII small subunit